MFKILYNTQECLVIQRIYLSTNYGNSDIINFIDASYIKTENTMILYWLQIMLEVISIIASRDVNPYQENLWIPKKVLLIQFIYLAKKSWGGANPKFGVQYQFIKLV